MPDTSDFGVSEFHETLRGGERVLIRPVRPEDMTLYPEFLGDVSAEDLRLRFGPVRLKDELDEKTAEFAILVRSRLKGHGLGWLLMRHVIDYAKEKALRRVYGDVLVENTTMLQMCAELGFHVVEDVGSDIRRVALDLEIIRGQ